MNLSERTLVDQKLINLMDPTIKHYFESIKIDDSIAPILRHVTNDFKEDTGVLNFIAPKNKQAHLLKYG